MQASFHSGIIPKWSIVEDRQKIKVKKKKKKERRSTRAGRVEKCCTIGGRNETDDKINKKIEVDRQSLRPIYKPKRYNTC